MFQNTSIIFSWRSSMGNSFLILLSKALFWRFSLVFGIAITLMCTMVGFDKYHVHLLCGFLAKYYGCHVIRLVKSTKFQRLFREFPSLEQDLWGGEFWTDGYYISTVSGRGDKKVIEKYIEGQGRIKDIKQLRLFGT